MPFVSPGDSLIYQLSKLLLIKYKRMLAILPIHRIVFLFNYAKLLQVGILLVGNTLHKLIETHVVLLLVDRCAPFEISQLLSHLISQFDSGKIDSALITKDMCSFFEHSIQ